MKRDRIPELLDALVVNPHYSTAGRKIGVNAATIFRWIERSRNDDPEFIVTWCGVEAQFADHVRKAIKMSVALIESQARTFALAGWDEPVVFQGKQCFVEDERCAGIDPDSFGLLGLPLDGIKRDADGNRIPLTVRRKPSDALVTLMLRSHMPNVYGDRSQVAVQHSGGVLVVGVPKKPDAGSPSGSSLGRIKDIDYVEIDEDMKPVEKRGGYLVVGPKKDEAELEAAYGGKHVLEPVEFEEEDGRVCTEPAPLPREQSRADTRATTTDAPVRPKTDLPKGLPARASAASKHPRSTAQVAVGRPADEPKPYVSPATRAEGYGPGVVPPGGFKVV